MAWKTVYILVEADSIDDAEQKALEVFETEGNDVSDGQFKLDFEEKTKTVHLLKTEKDSFILELLNEQIDWYRKAMINISLCTIQSNEVKGMRKLLSDYYTFLSPKITHHSFLYNGITYEPILDIKDLEKVSEKGYLVPIMFHY